MRKIGIILSLFILNLYGCNNGGPEWYVPPPDRLNPDFTPRLSLSLSQVTVKSDNSDRTTITASVLDESNVVVVGEIVRFSADGGALTASSAVTNEQGQARVDFSSGTNSFNNRIATVTATVGDPLEEELSTQIPIQIVGSTLEISVGKTELPLNGTTEVTVRALNASGVPVWDTLISVAASPGVISVSPATARTNSNGEVKFTVTGVYQGLATLDVKGLGVTVPQPFTVLGQTESSDYFRITSPVEDVISASTDVAITVRVSAPSPTTEVIFSTTMGSWDGISSVITKIPVNGIVSAQLRSSLAGQANIQIYDKARSDSLSDSLIVVFSAAASTASKISLQSSATVLSTSTDNFKNEAKLTATVLNSSNQVVGNAPVSFYIENPTGGGETVTPVVAFTNSSGQASAVFTSGSRPSGQEGVTVTAKLVEYPEKEPGKVAIIIGGTAGSMLIGRSTKIESIYTDTAYSLPMTVLVTDSSGGRVANAKVSLSVWPIEYLAMTGIDEEGAGVFQFFPNEDVNENLILDTGEDKNGDGELTPPSAAGGAIPSEVTTDAEGFATFKLNYQKQSALNIIVRIRATTIVQGTETRLSTTFVLPVKEGEEDLIPFSRWAPPSSL